MFQTDWDIWAKKKKKIKQHWESCGVMREKAFDCVKRAYTFALSWCVCE